MPWPLIAAMVASTAASTAGSVMSSQGGGGGSRYSPGLYQGDAYSDPVMNSLALTNMIQLGNASPADIRAMMERNSPLAQWIDRIRAIPEEPNIKMAAIEGLKEIAFGQEQGLTYEQRQGRNKAMGILFPQAGITDPGQLRDLQVKWKEDLNSTISKISEATTFEDRLSAISRLGDISGSFQDATTSFDSLLPLTRDELRSSIDTDSADARRSALGRANAGGYNPGGVLGEIAKEKLRLQQDSELNAIRNATGLAEARQGLLGREGDFLMQYLGRPEASAQTTANIAANQRLAAAGQRASPGVGGEGGNAIGAGLSGLGEGIGTAALLSQLGNSGGKSGGNSGSKSKPGVSTTAPLYNRGWGAT